MFFLRAFGYISANIKKEIENRILFGKLTFFIIAVNLYLLISTNNNSV